MVYLFEPPVDGSAGMVRTLPLQELLALSGELFDLSQNALSQTCLLPDPFA